MNIWQILALVVGLGVIGVAMYTLEIPKCSRRSISCNSASKSPQLTSSWGLFFIRLYNSCSTN
jgi:hypothetical protein